MTSKTGTKPMRSHFSSDWGFAVATIKFIHHRPDGMPEEVYQKKVAERMKAWRKTRVGRMYSFDHNRDRAPAETR